MELTTEMIEYLKAWAAAKTWKEQIEDFDPYAMSGGNYDDAYEGGSVDGYIELSRMILKNLKIEY